MKIVIAKTFASRHELDTYLAMLGEGAAVSLEMSAAEAAAMSLDESTTVHGAGVAVAAAAKAPRDATPMRGVLGGKRRARRKK